MPLIFYNNNKAKNDDLNILTNIFISKNFKIKDFNILEIIIEYKHSMENYEKMFFNNLIFDYPLQFYEKIFNKNFVDIFDDKIDIEHRINILKDYNLEIYDLEKIPIVIKDINDDGEFIFKWIGLKINKYSLCTSNINLQKIYRCLIDKNDQSIFYYNEIIKIFIEERICYHCFLKDLNTDLDDVFINELLSSVSDINNKNSN
tara:strand:- start:785 stop:1393 length:609 start_codon:yes stop_codon:yes gene_type:complete